jgi:hypothetical protein
MPRHVHPKMEKRKRRWINPDPDFFESLLWKREELELLLEDLGEGEGWK